MRTITTKDGTEIFYKDWGTGQPIVFHHGWPLSADDWDNQMLLAHHGFWGDGSLSCDQGGDEGPEDSFSASAGVVDELEECGIDNVANHRP
jgi:pimeloyl-ACP methyl ester carboxylesterase